MIYPIPPNLYCVPSVLCALTGADAASVIVPSINRHDRCADLLEAPAGVNVSRVARAVLEELGYRARAFKATGAASGQLRARVHTWAERSRKYPGRPVMVTTAGRDRHALVVYDGRIYDNHLPAGAAPQAHPFSTALVDGAWLVEKV